MRHLSDGGVYYKLQLMVVAFIRGRRLLEEIQYVRRNTVGTGLSGDPG